ncbi:MAG: phytanoyl-CoA dioxygenase family protein [Myxococcota bacterium]
MKLSSAQCEQYETDGYTVARGVLDASEIARILGRARAIAHGEHPPAAKSSVMRDIRFAKGLLPMPEDPERALWKIMNADRYDPALREAMRSPGLLDAVSGILGDDLLAFLFMLIYKPPQVPDSVHPFHQDGLYFQFEPHDLVVGAWVALDPVDEDNGTLCVVPGTHRLPITGHEVIPGVNAGAFGASGVEGSADMLAKAVTLELAPGDAVLFHPHLYHRTGGNRTDRHRRVLTIHFASARCRSLTPTQPDVYAFTLVRGKTFPGGLQPAAAPALGFRGDDVRL